MNHFQTTKTIGSSQIGPSYSDLVSQHFCTTARNRTENCLPGPIGALHFVGVANSIEVADVTEVPEGKPCRAKLFKQTDEQIVKLGNFLGAATAIGLCVAIDIIGAGNATCLLLGSATMFGLSFHSKSKRPHY